MNPEEIDNICHLAELRLAEFLRYFPGLMVLAAVGEGARRLDQALPLEDKTLRGLLVELRKFVEGRSPLANLRTEEDRRPLARFEAELTTLRDTLAARPRALLGDLLNGLALAREPEQARPGGHE